ncbi:MAG: DUF3592 domain-containing protein [Phycisphaerales bacterium]
MTRLKDIKNGRRRRVSGKPKNGLGCFGCFGVIWMLVVLGFDGFIGYQFWRAYDARTRFLAAEGEVTASWVESSSTSDGMTYEARVEYEFVLNGTTYYGDRHSYFSISTSSRGHAEEVVKRYPVGRRVQVHYDPGEPEDSVLEVDARSFPSIAILFLTPFHCIGIGFLAGGVGEVVGRRRLGEDADALVGLVAKRSRERLVLRDAHWRGWVVFLVVLGLTSFVSIFVVAFGFGSKVGVQSVLWVWGGCVGAGLLVPGLIRMKRAGRADTLEIDWLEGRFTRKPDSLGIPIVSIKTIRLESRDNGTTVNDKPWLTHTLTAIDEAGSEHLLVVAKGYGERGNALRDWFAARFEAVGEGEAEEVEPNMPVVSEVEINRTNT